MRDTAEIGFDFGQSRCGRGFALARVGKPGSRGFDGLGQLPILAGEQHLFPAPQFVTKFLVAAGLAGLAFQRAALLLDLEHDVVDARQVLLGGLEFQLGGAAARLVLRHACGFLDQLSTVGRACAENQSDLALLDDGVGLGAKTGVHQEVVDVAQAAGVTVNEVFAFPRAIEPPGHLDLPRNRLNQFLGLFRREDRALGHGHATLVRECPGQPEAMSAASVDPGSCALLSVSRDPVSVGAVSVGAVPVGAVPVHRLHVGERRPGHRLDHSAEAQTYLRGRGRLARIAAIEDDVFHLLATQALRALLTHHPGDGVGDVALAAAVRADDGGHALVEGKLRPVRKGLEAVYFKTFETHEDTTAPWLAHLHSNGAVRRRSDSTDGDARRTRTQRPRILAGLQNGTDRIVALSFSQTGERPRGRKTVVSVTRPIYWGKDKLQPHSLWSIDLRKGCRPRCARPTGRGRGCAPHRRVSRPLRTRRGQLVPADPPRPCAGAPRRSRTQLRRCGIGAWP